MSDEFEEVGPIDYLVVEFPGNRMTGEGLPTLVDLVDHGLIRILDLTFVKKDDVEEAAKALDAGNSAGILVYENLWAAPFATALRHGGARMVASGSRCLTSSPPRSDRGRSLSRHPMTAAGQKGNSHARSHSRGRAHRRRRRNSDRREDQKHRILES